MSSDYALIVSYFLLILVFVIPLATGIVWWRYSAERWWMHVLFTPALVVCLFAVSIALQSFLLAISGRLEGYPILVLPLYAGTAISAVAYYGVVVFKAARRLIHAAI